MAKFKQISISGNIHIFFGILPYLRRNIDTLYGNELENISIRQGVAVNMRRNRKQLFYSRNGRCNIRWGTLRNILRSFFFFGKSTLQCHNKTDDCERD